MSIAEIITFSLILGFAADLLRGNPNTSSGGDQPWSTIEFRRSSRDVTTFDALVFNTAYEAQLKNNIKKASQAYSLLQYKFPRNKVIEHNFHLLRIQESK